MISQITGEVKSHIAISRSFHASWLADTRPTLLTGIDDWENRRDFYERFDLAYAELLVEISSRRRRHDKAKRKAEEAQKELEQIVERLEHGEAPLDEALALWERGEKLYAFCREKLDGAQGKVEELARRVEQARPEPQA